MNSRKSRLICQWSSRTKIDYEMIHPFVLTFKILINSIGLCNLVHSIILSIHFQFHITNSGLTEFQILPYSICQLQSSTLPNYMSHKFLTCELEIRHVLNQSLLSLWLSSLIQDISILLQMSAHSINFYYF